MSEPEDLDWERDGEHWPHRESSRFVRVGRMHWHVQVLGAGPPLLLLHGTGASTHSWRDLAPNLARRFRVVMPDLPGHAFSALPDAGYASLNGMARAVSELVEALAEPPELAVGHSAGAAILCRMTLDERIRPRALVGLNAALLPFAGWASPIFSPVAKLMAAGTLSARLVAWRARTSDMVDRLVRQTGSRLDQRGIDFYTRLVRSPRHVRGALTMMANWNLAPLARDLPRLTTPLTLVVGESDGAVSPLEAPRIARWVRSGRVEMLQGLGHLAHEEAPDRAAHLIKEAFHV